MKSERKRRVGLNSENFCMVDPRLNSLHLDPERREQFRRAREVLLQSRGTETVHIEHLQENERKSNQTFIANTGGSIPSSTLDFWLVDRDYIYPLKFGLNTLGRSADNDVVVDDLFVSRRHCAILVHHDRTCVVQDIASKNGTFVNGTRITSPTKLQLGDEIRICSRQFVFLNRSSNPSTKDPDSATSHTLT